MEKQEVEFVESLAAEVSALKEGGAYQNTMSTISQMQKQNLVEWQLDFKYELEDIEHLLRNDIIVRDKNGNEFWDKNTDEDVIIFNDKGVNEIKLKIRMYLNKNMVLSNYNLEEIRTRLKDFAHWMRELIYINMEYYGLDNDYKISHYPNIVMDVTNMVESAYRRALNGEEKRGLNEARIVQQNEPLFRNQGGGQMQMRGQSAKKWWNPVSWIGG